MFIDDPIAPAIPGIDAIFTMLKSNLGYGLLAILLGLFIFIVVFKSKDYLDFFKERADKKHELEMKKIDQEEEHFISIKEMTNNGIVVLSKMSDKLDIFKSDIVNELHDVETNIKEDIHDMKTELVEMLKK